MSAKSPLSALVLDLPRANDWLAGLKSIEDRVAVGRVLLSAVHPLVILYRIVVRATLSALCQREENVSAPSQAKHRDVASKCRFSQATPHIAVGERDSRS